MGVKVHTYTWIKLLVRFEIILSESSQQRQGLVQSGSAGNLGGQDRNLPGNIGGQDQNLPGNLVEENQNPQIERSVSAGTLSVSSEENMEIPNTSKHDTLLFLQKFLCSPL